MPHRHNKHYYRITFLIGSGLVAFFVVRAFLIPASFNQFGHFRGANVEEQMDRAAHFGAKTVCAMCHPDLATQHQTGKHTSVPCQDCHDRVDVHANPESGEVIGTMPIQKTAQLCLRCHQQLPSRPTTFPQIGPEEHLRDMPEAHSPTICFSCHSPHDPTGAAAKEKSQ